MRSVRRFRMSWRDVLSGVIVVVILGVIVTAAGLLGAKASDNAQRIGAAQAENHAQDKQISSLVSSLADANKKLASAGLPTVPVVVQPSNGTNGRDGQDGTSVLAVTCGPDGVWSVAYSDGTTSTAGGGCIGTPGVQGVAGPAGATGADSEVPGPQGPAGADSTVPGPQGAPGVDGQPPVSWTFSDKGTDYTCTRTDPFSADAPTYQCAPTQAPNQGASK